MTISLGDVFLLRCTLCTPPKPKFFVVASSDPMLMFLINSEISPFMHSRPPLLAVQVSLAASEHAFLKYDSYLDGHHLSFEYQREALLKRLELEPSVRIGQLSESARSAVASMLPKARSLKRKHRDALIELWS